MVEPKNSPITGEELARALLHMDRHMLKSDCQMVENAVSQSLCHIEQRWKNLEAQVSVHVTPVLNVRITV